MLVVQGAHLENIDWDSFSFIVLAKVFTYFGFQSPSLPHLSLFPLSELDQLINKNYIL